MTIVTAGMEKKANAGGDLRPPCFVGDAQQCVAATEGADVIITVDLASTGGLPTAIVWRRGEQELVGDRYRVSENNNTVVLNLQNVTLDDAGHYTLTAKNSAGEARRAFEIKVEGAGSDVPVFLRRLSDLAVKVGTRTRFLVEIRCSAEVTVSWHRNNEQLLEGERFHFVHEGNFFCVDVAPVMMEDGGRWTCTAEGAGGRASCSSHLNVLVPKAYKAPEFLEELQALLTEQGTVSLECKVVGVPTPVLRWYKDGQEIKAGDVFALTANPDDPTSLGTYTCEAVNCMGKAYSSSRVHVVGKGSREGSLKPADSMKPVGPAPVFTQNLRDEKIKIGDTLTLTCQVSVPPWPQSVTWYNKEGRAEDGDRHHVMADGLGGYMMQISSAEAADEGEWKCVATSSLGARGISTCHVSMTYPKNYRKPRFLESLKAVMTEEGLVSFECKVVGFPTPQLRWFKDGEELKPGDVYQLTGTNSLGSYCCIAKNCMGQATSSAELTVEDIQNQLNEEERLQLFSTNQPPKFIVGLKSCEAKITEEFRFTVQVSISPEPSISWYRDDEQMEDTDRYRVSREALGNLHLDISSLEIIDQAEWKCVATNEFGHSVTSCFLKLIIPRHFKKPRFLESLRAILSEEGAVNLECKVIGVPQPVLKWYKDGEELKPGDIHRIISGQDGTCCLGTYTCEARNCMGTVASSASLLGFEERLMKTATQHKPEQTTGHILARNPSLSTIHEERTSQMYDTPATERSATMDERAEVSFSFDGKEVSVSLYETPDLTEEEALQVVEMYADQLSEHVSEHNVLELPPLRFVKETSNTGKLLMEAIVIDVTHDAFASAAADDDLRTDADLEEFSITDDNGQQAPPLPQDVEQDEDALYEKLDTEFLERALAPTVSYDICEEAVAPKRPPRRKTDSSQRAKPDGDTKGSDTSTKGGVTPKDDEDRSDHFTDAVAYISEKDSYASARGSSGDAKAYKVASVEERRIGESLSTKSSPPELLRNTELCTKRKHEESQGAELEQDVAHKQAKNTEHSSRPESLKKKVRSVESGLGRSFEESVEERMGGEPPGPKPERPARKGSRSRNEKSIESGQGGSFEESGDDRTSSETSIAAHKVDRKQSQKKGASSDVGSIESYLKKIQEQESILQEAKPGDLKRSSGKGSHVSTEVQTEGSIMKKELEPQQLLSLEIRDSGDTEETVERAGKQGHLSSSSVDLPTLKAAENLKSATGKGESSLIESLTRSLQGIQEGLASVEKQEQDKSTSEPGYEKSRLFLFEAQTQAIEDSLALVEEKRALGAPYEENMSSKMLVTTSQPTQEIHKTSASVEQKPDVELREKCMPEETSVPVLENVARPIEELARDTVDILQFAESTHEDTSETREEEFPELYMQSSVQTISQSIHELQRGMALLEQHIAFEDAGATTSHVDSASILATLSHPLHELRRGLAEVQQQTLLEAEEAPIGQSIMETFARPIEDLQEGLEALEQLTSLATGTTPITEPPGKTAVQFLAAPIDALKTGLSQIRHAFLIETKPSEKLPGNICVLESLQTTLQSLQDAVEIVPNISTLQETSGKVIVHDIGELRAVTLLARPLVDMQLCLNVLEITEFKSRGQPMLTTEGRDPRLDTLMGPLSGLHCQLAQIEERITAGSTRNLTSQSAHVVTVQSLLQPIRNLKRNIDVIRGIAISESTISNFDLNLLESLEKPLKEFTVTLVSIEQDAVLNVTPKQTANLNSLLTAKAVVNCIENVQETIVKVNERHTSEDQEEPEMKATSKLEKLSQPLFQIKQTLVGAVQNVLLDESKVIPESTAGNALESIVSLLEVMQKELCVIERDLITKKETEPKTKKSVETLLRPIKELQDGITATARQLTEAAPGTSGLSALESLLEPLQGLQMAITVVAPKETSLLILDSVTESFEALLRGVAATEKQVLAQAMKDPRKLSVTKLGALTEPLKELQKEISLVEQKIQFESEEQLASESSSINALSGLVQPLRELQRGLLLIEHFALEQDVKPLVQKVAGVLVEPILELQRGISAINQKATWHADAVQSKGFTILETLAQPLQVLQRALSVVEEQNIMILEEALIFEKASSLAAVEKVTESVQELHHRISSIEHFFSFETVAKRNEFVGLSDLHKIAKPLMGIHERLNQVEDYIFEAGDKPMSERAIILCLDAIAKPMKDLTTELSQVEQALTREPDSKFDQDELGPSPLQTLARPINALQCNIAVIQRLATQTETASVFQTLAQPLQDLQDGLTILQGHTAMETLAEQPTQKSSVTALHTLATSIEEIHSGIVLMKEQAGSEGLELTVSEHDAASFLEAITHPLKELQKNLGQVQHQILLEKTTEYPSDTLLLAFAIPVWELQRGLALIEQNALLESSDKPLTAVSMVQVIAQPVQEIHTALAQIHEQVLLEAPDTPVFDRSDISILKTLANPIHELQKSLAVLEHHVVLDPHEEQMSDKLGTSVLETIAQPLEELHKNLVLVEQHVLLEAGERSMSEEAGLSVLETLAHPIQELERGIAFIQHQVALEAREVEMSDKSTVSILKTLAQPLQEMQRGLLQIEEQLVMEVREEPLSEKSDLSLLKTLAKPIEEIQKSIAVIEQQVIFEANVQPFPKITATSMLKELASPLYELQQNLVQIEQQVALEAKDEFVSELSLSVLKTVAQPIHDMQRTIALIQQQEMLEAGGEDLSDRTSMTLLQTLAQPLEELEKGIAEIQQQIALEATEEPISENSTFSVLQSLAEPLQEICRGIAVIQECAVYEGGVETLSEKTDVSALQALAQPIQELLERIAVLQQQAPVEHCEVLSENEDMSVLMKLAQPVEELQRTLLQVEQQVALEADVGDIQIQSVPLLRKLAQPIIELQTRIALIEKQAVLESAECLSTDEGNLSLLRELAVPLQELQKGIVMIEQQELLEGPLSDDATNISDLRTSVSSADASQVLGAMLVEEQRALESETDALTARTDARELESTAVSQQEPKRNVAVVQEQTALDGNVSKLATETYEAQVALLSREMERGTATVEGLEVVQEESIENVSKEAGVETELMECKEQQQEECEIRKTEEKEAELKNKEQAEAERKRNEQEESERRKKEEEEAELKKKEQAEAERKRKDQEEAERRKKEEEEAELKKKEQAEAERKRKEQEEAERRKKEEEEAELKKKEHAEAERKRKEQEEAERRKKEEEEAELKKKEQAEAERKRKEQEEAERRKKEEEEAERKGKEMAEKELEQTRAGGKTRKEGNKSRTVGKRKTDGKMKEREERKQDEKLLEDLKESDDSRKIKEQVEPENNEDVTENDKSCHAMQAAEDKAVESVKAEGVMLSEVSGTKETADSCDRVDTASETKRSRKNAEDTEKETAKSRTESVQNDVKVEWIAEGAVQKTRSFDDRPWAEESAVGRHRQYDDALDSSDTITYSSTSSTLTPTQHTLGRTEGTRRIVVKEKVESGPRDARKKPTFATRLTDRTAAQGSRIKLTCSVLGSPEPVVEWLRDGLPLVGEHRYKTRCEDGLASLEVLNASPGDSGEFTCVARNLHGEASSTATLKVFAGFEPAPSPPTFTRAIKDSYRFSDDELILECRVRCHPPPKITWLKDGVTLQGSNRHQQSEVADGVCRLIISSPDATADSGQYTCVAENNVWSDQISSAVQFAGRDSYATSRRSKATSRVSRDARRPHISNVLTDHAVPVGGTIALQVEVKGAPKLDVTWLRSNEPLHFLTPKIRKFEDSGVYSLVVTDVTEREAGLYTCRASNAYGHVDTSATVGIVAPGSVRGGKPAMFINRPDMDMAVAVGEDISVSFRVTGDPRPKVTWMKGIRDITNSQRSLKERLDDYVRLTLKRALVSDAGTYCILAKNIYGCDRAFFTVTIRQRARSLTPSLEWNSQTTSDILRDVRDSIEIGRMKDVPGPVAGEPAVVDSGRNWLTLSWPKSEVRGGAPVVAYRVEAWPLGGEGGARWIEMGVSPTNTFDAFNLKAGTEYKFRVTPRNRYGWGESVTTTAATVVGRKVELPEFTRILPGQLKALQGSSIGLECEVRGDPVPRVQWYRDGMELDDPRFVAHFDGSHLCQLTIQELRDGDSGRYMCEATNRVGRVSTFARLFVVNDPKILEADHKLKRGIQDDQQTGADMPPQFTMRLRDRRVQMTYPVRLTCQVAGCPAPAVTWSKDGDVIKEDDHHAFSSEGNFHTLEMSHTTLEDSGCYSATARNANGAVCCRCHLVVDKGIRAYVAPEFLFELEPEHFVREGGELRLSAQVEAYPTVGVMWHRDGVRLRPSRRTVMTLNHDGTVELALAGVSRRDAGVYSCTATNEVGRAETSTRVNVQATEAPPTADLPAVIGPEVPYSKVPLFVTKPRSTEAVEGDTVIILCEVVGDPKPEVMWLRDWLKPDYYRDAPHFRRVGDGPQYRLEIPHAKLDFTGAYSVIARNCHGEAKAVISLQIYAKGQGKENGMDRSSVKHGKVQTLPVVKRELKDLRCCDGDAVTLECCVQATPAPDIRWEKGGRLLPLGGDFSVEFDGDTARLHIHQVYPEDEGEYTCVAYNELGRAVTSACLVVDVPEEKETLLSRQLSRPVGLLSAGSTPRSTPRTTPSRSKSPSEPRHRDRDGTPPRYIHGESGRHRLKAAAPKFYAVPHNRVAEEGETVRFQCAIAGHPTPWVSWDKDGVLVTPSARLTLSERDDLRILEISEVTVEDAGFYRIALENEVGRIEASARLEVIGHYGGRSRVVRAWSASPRTSPTFGRRLIGSAARVGGRLALACDIRGSPTPASSWYRNGELVVRSSRVTPTWDGRTARLEIENLELEDAGMYTCVAENEMGKTRCSARLVVLDKDDPSQEDRQPPVFLQNLPPEVVATDGELLELQVRLQGTPPLDVVWVKDGVEIADCEDFRYVDRGDGHFGLRLADVFPQDAGTYCCEAYNEHGEATTSSFLSVREGSTSVQFSKRPTPVLTSPGSTVTFCARVDSCGVRPEVSWTVAGRPLDCSRHKVDCEGDVHMLHISPVELCDSGQVTCVARTGMSRDEQCVTRTQLTVRDDDDMFDEVDSCCMQSADVAPAMLLRGPSDTTALRGDRVVLKATYVGFPRPVVRWLKAGHELSSGDRLTITTADGVTCLVMERITADDSGKYVVSVENDLGADCNYASVAVEGPADPPAGRPTVCCSGNTATVAWCSAPYDGGCMVTGYCVEMRRKKDTEWQVVTERCHSLSYVVAGLIAAEQYVFRVRAENAHGLSEASAESEPFQMGSDEESFMPAFEPRVVTLAPGEEFKANFEVLEELGKGRYGVVHKVAEHATGQKYAAKFIRCIKAKDREKVQEEIDVMNMLRHPKLLQLAAAFESPREVVMVMEYISGGELFERVVADDFTLTERDCILFTRQICEGVDYMHHNYVVHLDLKPENIMCHTRTSHQIKLIDFGLAQKINPDTPVRVLFGTPEFIPPEIINYEPIGVESDMWSVGVICYVLLSGLSPFMGDNDAETFANITRADYDFDDEAFDAISQDAKDFISALLVKRKEKRLTARECLQHIWLAQHDEKMSCVKLCTDKLKKFIIRRKWQLNVVLKRQTA